MDGCKTRGVGRERVKEKEEAKDKYVVGGVWWWCRGNDDGTALGDDEQATLTCAGRELNPLGAKKAWQAR
jgi:hypothetical protein